MLGPKLLAGVRGACSPRGVSAYGPTRAAVVLVLRRSC
ncbi:hypothetical protein T261_2698 [Streptomyces lydicus]|nr:hypothetical protein T261_2698 [Streptomyces lydicus]